MPGRDGTGPMGQGSMSGRGLGLCSGTPIRKCGYGLGRGLRQGYGRNCFSYSPNSESEKQLLSEQKDLLESRLDFINKKLENL